MWGTAGHRLAQQHGKALPSSLYGTLVGGLGGPADRPCVGTTRHWYNVPEVDQLPLAGPPLLGAVSRRPPLVMGHVQAQVPAT